MSPLTPARARQIARSLSFATLAGLLLTGWLVWRLVRPLPAWTPPALELESSGPIESAPTTESDPARLAVIWQRDLRQLVVDAPVKSPEAPREPEFAIRLIGTAVEADRRYGVFRVGHGATLVRPVGAVVGGYEVVDVARGRVRLRQGQREFELKVPWYDQIRPSGEE